MAARPTHSIESCLLLAYLRDEAGSDEVDDILNDPECAVVVHKLVLIDLVTNLLVTDGPDVADSAWARSFEVFQVSDELGDGYARRLSRWRFRLPGRPSLCAAAALAEELGSALIVHATVPSVEEIEQEGLEVLVVPSRAKALAGVAVGSETREGKVNIELTQGETGGDRSDAGRASVPAPPLAGDVDSGEATNGEDVGGSAIDLWSTTDPGETGRDGSTG